MSPESQLRPPRGVRARLARSHCLGGMLLWLGCVAVLAVAAPIGAHWLLCGLAYASAFLGLALAYRSFPPQWSWSRAVAVIFLLAVAGRLMLLPTPAGNDLARYIFEGAGLARGLNPYVLAPAASHPDIAALAAELPRIHAGINHPGMTAIYPPLAELIFAMWAKLSPSPLAFKLWLTLCDLATLALLAMLARSRGFAARRLLLYAANPLVLVYVAGEGHLDALMALGLTATLVLLDRGRARLGFLALGCAALTKYLAAAAWPMLVRGPRWRTALWALLPALLFVPFLGDSGADSGLFASLASFGLDMHTGDTVAALVRDLVGSHAAPWLLAAIWLTGAAIIWLTTPGRLRATFLVLGLTLLLLPTLHPWYLLLIAPLLVLFPSRAWLYACAAAALATFPARGIEFAGSGFVEIVWLKWLAWLPFFGLLAWEAWQGPAPERRPAYGPVARLSVVIPTLNEAAELPGCLAALARGPAPFEVIVADGGSEDQTRATAERLGARVLDAPRGRGCQIRCGVAAAQGDAVLILHADGRIPRGAVAALVAELNCHPDAVGGAMAMRFTRRWGARRRRLLGTLTLANNLRARLMGISFGDQGQFVRRDGLAAMGGFPDLPLMEDVELAARMLEHGRVLFLEPPLRVSPRGWSKQDTGPGVRGQVSGRVFTVLRLTGAYLARRRLGLAVDAAACYRDYYGAAPADPGERGPCDVGVSPPLKS